MNALCYKIVFSKRLGSLVAVGEHTAGQGKAAGTGVRAGVFPEGAGAASHGASGNFVGLLKSVFASVAISCVTTGLATAAGPAANTLPTGYSVNSGNVAISSTSSATNAAMTIQQTTDKASINWQSFSIGSGAAVNIQQNSASSVLLNRVVGNDPSQIFGKLTANGQVILINPNGIVFGKGGSVTASAFTASTFGMTEEDFKKGKNKFTRNGSTAGVTVEQGANISTTAPSGYVALIGASVDNQGAITTKEGAVVLAAGESVALPAAMTDSVGIPLSKKVRLELAPSTINASVENGGTITTEGGQVLMQAAALSDAVASITHTGTIDTTGEQGGAVEILANNGHIRVSGSVTTNSSNGLAGGDIYIGRDVHTNILAAVADARGAKLESKGGFIETSGQKLIVDGIQVKAKDWLLDPNDIVIGTETTTATNNNGAYTSTAGSSFVNATDLGNALDNGTSITVQTTASVSGGSGNITVNENVTSKGNASLTLKADNNIIVHKAIKAGDNAMGLNVTLDAGNTTASGGITVNTDGAIDAKAGNVILKTRGGSIVSSSASGIKGKNISLDNSGGVIGADGAISKGNKFASTKTAINIGGGGLSASENIHVMAIAQGQMGLLNTAKLEAKKIQVNAETTNHTAIHMTTGTDIKILAGGSNNLIKGTATGTSGGQAFWITGNVSIDANEANITLDGNASTVGGGSWANKRGLRVDTATTSMSGNVTLKGSSGSSDGVLFIGSANNTIKSGGKLTVEGVNSSTSGDTNGVQFVNNGGVKGETDSTIRIQGTLMNNISGLGALLHGGGIDSGGQIEVLGDRQSNSGFAVNIGSLVRSTASDVVVRSLGGSIATNNSSNIQGSNITIDNTNGVIDSSTGAITSKGTAISFTNGVTLGGSITARNNLNVYGSSSQAGVVVASGTLRGKNVTITGDGQNERGVLSYTSVTTPIVITPLIEATAGNLLIKGTTNASQTSISLEGNGTIKASGHIELQGDRQTLAQTINAGSGTGNVTLKTTTGNRAINIGDADSSSALGISQNELNLITADKTIISSSSAGKITTQDAVITDIKNGNVTLQTSGDIEFKAALSVGGSNGTKKLTLNAGGTVKQTDATAAIKAAELQLVGGSGNYMLNNQSNSIGKISGSAMKIEFKNIGDLNVGSATETLDAKDGVTVLTGGTLDIQNKVTNTDSGDVILAAGYGHAAESGLGNNILTNGGATVSNGSRSIRLYTGSTTGTGKLANLHSSLGKLDLEAGVTGTDTKQNTMTGASFLEAQSIEGGANVQAFFREKVAFNTTFTAPAEVVKSYGETGTKNAGTQLADTVKSALKEANIGNASLTTNNENTFQIKKSTLIDNMAFEGGKALSNEALSTSNHLKANASNETYNSSKLSTSNNAYTLSDVIAGTVKIKITQKPVVVIYTAKDKVFDGSTAADVSGTVASITGDKVNVLHTSANFDSPDIGTAKTVTVSDISLSGSDAANYKLDPESNPGNKATSSASIIARPPTPPTPIVPTNNTGGRVKIPTGSANPFALASAEDLADDTCSANSIENCHCEESAVSQGVDICYEPKDGGKGTAR